MEKKFFLTILAICSFIVFLTTVNKNIFAMDYDSFDEKNHINDVAVELRNHLVNREKEITLTVYTDEEVKEYVKKIYKEALIPTDVGYEGDYLNWSIRDVKCKIISKNGSCLTIKYLVNYRTSRAEEKEITEMIKNLETKIQDDNPKKTLWNINKIICDNFSYDKKASDASKTVYGALKNKKAVCIAYSMLFYRMSLDCKIPCRIVTGHVGKKYHSWNVVTSDDNYYHIDSTFYDSSKDKKFFHNSFKNLGKRTIDEEFKKYTK